MKLREDNYFLEHQKDKFLKSQLLKRIAHRKKFALLI